MPKHTDPKRPRCTLIMIDDGSPVESPSWGHRFVPANNLSAWEGVRVSLNRWPCGGGGRVVQKTEPFGVGED